MREYQSISQRLWLSPDERLKKYVRENDIVDTELLLMMTTKMMKNRSISQRLQLSLDERLKKYVRENDIVVIELDKNVLAAAFDDDN
jgi:hypothetical protein